MRMGLMVMFLINGINEKVVIEGRSRCWWKLFVDIIYKQFLKGGMLLSAIFHIIINILDSKDVFARLDKNAEATYQPGAARSAPCWNSCTLFVGMGD